MTTYEDVEIDFDAVSAPISGETKATVELVGNDWRSDMDWRIFTDACEWAARQDTGLVDPARVREYLSDSNGELMIFPRRLSAFYHRAAGKNGFLDFHDWITNQDSKGRNKGKPARRYRWRT